MHTFSSFISRFFQIELLCINNVYNKCEKWKSLNYQSIIALTLIASSPSNDYIILW